MSNQQSSFSRLFNAPTDVPAFLVILLGLAIALFLGDLPVRLIGVCIAVLGSIGVIVLYNQRIKDVAAMQEYASQEAALKAAVQNATQNAGQKNAQKSVSEQTDFKTTVKQESGSKRLVFDDFAESFGTVEEPLEKPLEKSSEKLSEKSLESASHQGASSLAKADTPPHIDQPSKTSSANSSPSKQESASQPPPKSIPTPTLPKTLVFDDFEDTAGFDDVNEITLVTAPEKFTPSEPLPVIPTLPSTVQQTLTANAGAAHTALHTTDTASGKKVLVFDDSDESISFGNDISLEIKRGQTSLPPELQQEPELPPVTPAPPPVVLTEAVPGQYIAPKLDETLLGAEFDDDDGTEFRIVGKTAPALAPQPLTLASESIADKNIPDDSKKKTDELTQKPDISLSQGGNEAPQGNAAQDFAQAVIAETPDISSPQELTDNEEVQDKVTRAAKAALRREDFTAPKQTTSAPKQPANQASTALSEEAVSHRRKKLTVQMEDIVEETPEGAKNEPRREFEYLLQRILLVIRSAMSARTAAYWWFAADRKQLTLEAKITDVPDALVSNPTLPLGEDTLSHIAETGSPEILSEISNDAELKLLPYYAKTASTRSFVGVPVYFNKAVVGVLTADSTDNDAYDNATVSFLGHFTKLIGGLIQSYTEKYDLLQSARTLDAIDTFRQLTLKPDRTNEDVCTALIRSLMRLVPYTTIGTCIYAESRGAAPLNTPNGEAAGGWYVSNLHTKDVQARAILGAEVYLDNSLVGKTITNGRTYRFANPAANFIRVAQPEPKPPTMAFTAVPLVSVSRCYGALFIEESGETRLTKQDVEIIETVCEYAGTALEQMQLQDYVQTHALLQEAGDNTLVASTAFVQRVREELARAEDVELSLTIALVSLDKYAAFSNNPVLWDELNYALVQMLRKNLRPYDIIARYHGTTLAVCLIEKNTQAAQMWAEKVRREIAGTSLNVGGKQYSVTVSMGLAEFLKQASADELFEHAEKALDSALKKSNSVSIFS